MTDATTRAIAETLRRWYEAPGAQVIDFFRAREQLRQRRAIRYLRRPRGTDPTPPKAA
ncbi:MAG TPA: hypothetical protein VGE19_07295 [Pseudoxanthomonas sp.]